jgi:hypothetical protein
MAIKDGKYYASPQEIETFQAARQNLEAAEDIARRFREAGEPNAEQEARILAMREKLERYAKAFDLPLE